jgi:CoA-transferase family III
MSMSGGASDRLLGRAWSDLGRDPDELAAADALPEAPLPARLDVSALAVGSVAAVSLAAAGMDERMPRLHLDGDRIATAFTSERAFTIDGTRPAAWAPLSGFWRARDAWVRTHGNYPHHAAVLRRVLGLGDDADAAAAGAAIAEREASALARDVSAVGGMCVVVAPEDPSRDARLAQTPLIDVRRIADAAPRRRADTPGPERPLAGIRVLDLTRVIAGPIATRTLALLGAQVLRVDPPRPAEIGWQHLDTGAGKRSAILDLGEEADSARFDELLGSADVVVLGYRPRSLARLGLSPAMLAERHPGLVIAQLSAWGFDDADAGRGGFDSLVQASSGIALVEGDADAPGALPAQALDHATGYLLAAAVITLLERQAKAGGSWSVRMSLRRTAAELLTMPRTAETSPPRALDDPTRQSHLTTLVTREGAVRLPLPAIAFAGGPTDWPEAPHPWGSDAAEFPE